MYLMARSLATRRHHWEPPPKEATRFCPEDRCIVAGLLAKRKEILLRKTSRIVPCLCKCVQKREEEKTTHANRKRVLTPTRRRWFC